MHAKELQKKLGKGKSGGRCHSARRKLIVQEGLSRLDSEFLGTEGVNPEGEKSAKPIKKRENRKNAVL